MLIPITTTACMHGQIDNLDNRLQLTILISSLCKFLKEGHCTIRNKRTLSLGGNWVMGENPSHHFTLAHFLSSIEKEIQNVTTMDIFQLTGLTQHWT